MEIEKQTRKIKPSFLFIAPLKVTNNVQDVHGNLFSQTLTTSTATFEIGI
jgi:hypothetical protein